MLGVNRLLHLRVSRKVESVGERSPLLGHSIIAATSSTVNIN